MSLRKPFDQSSEVLCGPGIVADMKAVGQINAVAFEKALHDLASSWMVYLVRDHREFLSDVMVVGVERRGISAQNRKVHVQEQGAVFCK